MDLVALRTAGPGRVMWVKIMGIRQFRNPTGVRVRDLVVNQGARRPDRCRVRRRRGHALVVLSRQSTVVGRSPPYAWVRTTSPSPTWVPMSASPRGTSAVAKAARTSGSTWRGRWNSDHQPSTLPRAAGVRSSVVAEATSKRRSGYRRRAWRTISPDRSMPDTSRPSWGEVCSDRARAAAHVEDRTEPTHCLGEGGQPRSQPRLLRRQVPGAEVDVRQRRRCRRNPGQARDRPLLHASEPIAARTAVRCPGAARPNMPQWVAYSPHEPVCGWSNRMLCVRWSSVGECRSGPEGSSEPGPGLNLGHRGGRDRRRGRVSSARPCARRRPRTRAPRPGRGRQGRPPPS